MEKKLVKILDSIAGLADPRPREELDRKYELQRRSMENREKPPRKETIDAVIEEMKRRDRYSEPMLGFPRDWSFRPGEEVLIDAQLAEKWEACGLCIILTEESDRDPRRRPSQARIAGGARV